MENPFPDKKTDALLSITGGIDKITDLLTGRRKNTVKDFWRILE